jgi:hypothetical protein
MKRFLLSVLFVLVAFSLKAQHILIPMDNSQTNHLKAYGIMFLVLEKGGYGDWLLNYRGGSFAFPYNREIEKECLIRNVRYEVIANAQMSKILTEIADPESNTDAIRLEKAPKVAVYSPPSKLPWDDAVTLVLTYAEIPYTVLYDEELLRGDLATYDWLHLHHEDFTGQYGKFYASYQHAEWYQREVRNMEALAKKLGFNKVSQLKLGVVKEIRNFVLGGGFMFAMCSATDTYDIALAADGVDICHQVFDGDPMDPKAQSKLNYDNCFAFKDFTLVTNPMEYEFSNIDRDANMRVDEVVDFFTLFDFSAKWDPIPTMLTQNHTKTIKGFMGQTTDFKKTLIRQDVLVMGESKALGQARYLHGTFGKGTWSFYGGHDPEDYRHFVGDPPTDLNLHPNSPGYRLILNNILFPAAKKKQQRT